MRSASDAAAGHRRRPAAIAGSIACALAFTGLTIAAGLGALDPIDSGVRDDLVAGGDSPLMRASIAVAWAGAGVTTTVVGAGLILARVTSGRRAALGSWLLALISGSVLAWIVKYVVARPRPEPVVSRLSAAQFGPSTDAFPSGHAVTAALLASLVWHLSRRPAARALGVCWALAVAASRVSIGAHWPTDVIAGAIAGFGIGLGWPLPHASPGRRGGGSSHRSRGP